jgi:hypothetical protein
VVRGKLRKDDILAKAEIDPATCVHPNLKFERYGAILGCVDCKKRWFACTGIEAPDGSFAYVAPDFTYGNPKMAVDDTRHSRFEAQRTEPKK